MPCRVQLSGGGHEMMEKLEAVDVETLAPIKALNFASGLKKTLKGSLNS